jgi:hypothetical protein
MSPRVRIGAGVRLLGFCGLLASAWLTCAPPAAAQSGLEVQTQLSSRRAEVGEIFQLQFTVLGDAGSPPPSAPRLRVPPGFSVQGPSVSSQQQVSISGGTMQQRTGLSATWLLSASKPGVYKLGPPSVAVGGNTVQGRTVQVEITAAGQGGGARSRRAPSRRPFDPFDPFDFLRQPGMPSLPGFDLSDPRASDEALQLPPVPEEYRVDRAPDDTAFLRATATPARAILGEQVTLRVYAYGCRGAFREANTSEASKPDFLSYSIVDNAQNERMHRVAIGDAICHAVKIRELALFPIKAGTLTIGPMRMAFDGRGYSGGIAGQGLLRESAPIEVRVSEPPLQDRPPGYELGTAGSFSLSGSVEPRELVEGDAVSVRVKLQGVGNLPHKLRTPQQAGVEWLVPTTVEEIEPRDGKIQGYRKWSYVVRVDKPGRVELGEINLPFWDVERRRYDTARFELGAVDVKASDRPKTAEQKPEVDPLASLMAPRTEIGEEPARALHLADRPWFWLLLAAGPMSVLLVSGGHSLGGRLRQRLRDRHTATGSQATRALAEGRAAAQRGEHALAAGAIERALFLSIEGATGLRARAVLKERLAAELLQSGIPDALASEAASVLHACDELRFTASSAESTSELALRATRVVTELGKVPDQARRRGAG